VANPSLGLPPFFKTKVSQKSYARDLSFKLDLEQGWHHDNSSLIDVSAFIRDFFNSVGVQAPTELNAP